MNIKESTKIKNKRFDKIIRNILLIAAIISASMIILIVFEISSRGLLPFVRFYEENGESIRVNFFEFITGNHYYEPVYHIGFIIINTLYIVILATIISTPIAILTALFIAKMAPKMIGNILNTIIEVLAAIPSIIYGIFGMGYITGTVQAIASAFGINTFAGRSTLATVIVLAIMILPTVTMLSITAIRSVSKDIEQGSLALGASETQTMFRISLNAAKPGIFAGVIIGVGRALGEATAVSLVAGNRLYGPSFGIFQMTRTLTSTMMLGLHETAGLNLDIRFSIGLVLIVVILITNFLLNLVKRRLNRYYA